MAREIIHEMYVLGYIVPHVFYYCDVYFRPAFVLVNLKDTSFPHTIFKI